VCACLDCGHGWITFVMWSNTLLPFVHATWEEYYTGQLQLGVINGPTEGILLGCLFILTNALFGRLPDRLCQKQTLLFKTS
jgi:ethanolaminephosphotransferase